MCNNSFRNKDIEKFYEMLKKFRKNKNPFIFEVHGMLREKKATVCCIIQSD